MLEVETVRVRPQGMDRKLRVEYVMDPEDSRAVLMRVSLTSDLDVPVTPSMLTTQQAADQLNVSRPYVTRLVDAGKVKGVERTANGHRRIPVAEVERLKAEMRRSSRTGLDSIREQTSAIAEMELREARASKSRWRAKA